MPGVGRGGPADRLQPADEIAGGMLRRHPLIVKADLIAHRMVAKDDLQRFPFSSTRHGR